MAEFIFHKGFGGKWGVKIEERIDIPENECIAIVSSLEDGWWPPNYIIMDQFYHSEVGNTCLQRLLEIYEFYKVYGENTEVEYSELLDVKFANKVSFKKKGKI